MGIDRRARRAPPGFDIGEKPQQRRQVVALRKSFSLHQAFAREDRVGIEEAVGGDEIDLGHVRPARQQRLQHARGGRFAHRHRARDADDVRHLGILGAEKVLLRAEQALRGRDIEREQARQRQIDLLDLLHVEAIVERAHAAHLVGGERHRRVFAPLRPFRAGEDAIGRQALVRALFHHACSAFA